MSFISYAQNREDAVLWRALGKYGPGFYIDVGAGDPIADSATKSFSAAGWRGINIDPMPQPIELLRADRPRDINLQLALEDKPGSKTDDEITVEVDTLANVCARFARDEIHFLKVDVEGSEALVFAGADFQRFRPWVIVVDSQSTILEMWEPSLIAAGYQFVLFDGLNRFYVATEKADLLAEVLAVPCNVLDDVVAAELVALDAEREELVVLRATVESLQNQIDGVFDELKEKSEALDLRDAELDDANQQLYELSRHVSSLVARVHRRDSDIAEAEHNAKLWEEQASALSRELQSVVSSKAWRLTKPLRVLRRLVRRGAS